MVPQNCPYAALSAPFRSRTIGTRNYDHVSVCKFRNQDLQEDCIKNKEVAFYRLPDNGNTSWKDFEGFCSGNIARQTRPSRPFWASFWSWHSRLSPYISYIPIHSSKKSKNKSRTNKQIHTKAPKTQKNWVANYLFHDSRRLHHTSTFQIPGTMDDPMMTPWPQGCFRHATPSNWDRRWSWVPSCP